MTGVRECCHKFIQFQHVDNNLLWQTGQFYIVSTYSSMQTNTFICFCYTVRAFFKLQSEYIRAAQNGTCCEVVIDGIWRLPSMNWYTHRDIELWVLEGIFQLCAFPTLNKGQNGYPSDGPPKKGSSAARNFQFDSRQIHLLQLPSCFPFTPLSSKGTIKPGFK